LANDGSSPLIARFDRFEVDVRSCDLSKAGKAIVIQKQPFQVLCLLLKAEGEVVTREQLRSILWPEDTFVDFEHGVNTAVKKVRQALKDSAERPRFIETLPKIGYRFLVQVEWVNGNNGSRDLQSIEPEGQAFTPQPLDENVDNSKKSEVRHFWWKIAVPAIFVVVCAAIAVWYTRRPLPVPQVVAYTQITHDGRQKVVAGTDGTRIYFTELSPNFIAQVGITGGEIVAMPIAVPGVSAFLQDISSDGSSALIVSYDEAEFGDGHLWTSRIVGGSLRRVGEAQSAAFSPAGDSLIYSNSAGDIYSARNDGAASKKIAGAGPLALGAQLSPDGKVIRFHRGGVLYEMSSDGSGLHPLFPNWKVPGFQRWGRWTPDGRFYLFDVQSPLDGNQIWALDERRRIFRKPSREPIRLTSGPIRWGSPIPSSDGKKIFTIGETPRGELSRYDARTGQFQPYLGSISAEFVSFSKDGKSVAYVTFPDGILWKADRDGSHPVQLTEPPLYPVHPRWSPDGKQIVFGAQSFPAGYAVFSWETTPKIYVVPSEGGSPKRLLPEESRSQHDPSWSPDGERIVFGWEVPRPRGNHELRILELTTHEVSTVPGSVGFWSPRWSPDGRYIVALSTEAPMLRVFDIMTHKWLALETNGDAKFQAFSKDSRFIYFMRSGRDQGVFRIRVTGGKAERVVDLNNLHITGLVGFSMSLDPDDAPMVLRDVGTDDIYALTLDG